MQNPIDLRYSERPLVFVDSSVDGITLDFIEKALANICRVKAYSEKFAEWKDGLSNLTINNHFSVSNTLPSYTNYFAFFSSFFGGKQSSIEQVFKEDKNRIDRLVSSTSFDKSIFVFDFSTLLYKSDIERFIAELLGHSNTVYKILFVGETLGARVKKNNLSYINKIISGCVAGKVEAPKDKNYYPFSCSELSRSLVRNLFSFSDKKSEIVIGPKLSTNTLISRILSVVEDVTFSYVNEEIIDPTRYLGVSFIRSDTKRSIGKMYNAFLQQKHFDRAKTIRQVSKKFDGEKHRSKDEKKRSKTRRFQDFFMKSKNNKKYVVEVEKRNFFQQRHDRISKLKRAFGKMYFINRRYKHISRVLGVTYLLFLIFVVFPYFFTILSFAGFAYGQNLIVKGNFERAEKIFDLSSSFARTTNFQLDVYGQVSNSNLFPTLNQYSLVLEKICNVAERSSRTARMTQKLVKKMLVGETYDVNFYMNNLSLDLDYLYTQTGFLYGEIEALSGVGSSFVKKVFYKIDLDSLRKKVGGGKIIAENLPVLLGVEKEKTYLILFQNNMELRPTGGFIGSFAVVKINKGRMIQMKVYDVYDADGQLTGYVEPPAQLSTFLKVDNWYLRDSNWDPNFSVSAQRAEWFLDKELNIKVDGVVAVDLNFVKDLVNSVGTLDLPDYDKTLDSNNFYEITQYEAEKNFVPGSRGKTNILSAIVESLIEKTINEEVSYVAMVRALYFGLNSKSVQVFVHQANVQREIEALNWAGSTVLNRCGDYNCYNDNLQIVEANLGSNKANYYVERLANLNISINESRVKRTLSIRFLNNANPALGGKGTYKNYLRILVPKESLVDDVRIIKNDKYESVSPSLEIKNNILSAGVYFELASQEDKIIVFSWRSEDNVGLNKSGRYNLKWRKQAGVINMPAEITLQVPQNFTYSTNPVPSLTDKLGSVYNTTLLEDRDIQVYW